MRRALVKPVGLVHTLPSQVLMLQRTKRHERESDAAWPEQESEAVLGPERNGGGGNRTRVRGRTGQSVYERSPCLISPAGRFTDDLPTGQPS